MRSGLHALLGIVRRSIRLRPKDAKAYYNRGLAYSEKRDHDKAIADFTAAIRLDPKYAKAYYSRGAAYSEKSDHDKAEADFAEAKKLGLPSTGKTKWAESHYG